MGGDPEATPTHLVTQMDQWPPGPDYKGMLMLMPRIPDASGFCGTNFWLGMVIPESAGDLNRCVKAIRKHSADT